MGKKLLRLSHPSRHPPAQLPTPRYVVCYFGTRGPPDREAIEWDAREAGMTQVHEKGMAQGMGALADKLASCGINEGLIRKAVEELRC